MLEDVQNSLERIREGLKNKAERLNLAGKREKLEELENQANAPDLWNDSAFAQQVMQRLAAARDAVAPFDTIDKRAADLIELVDMARMEDDADLARDIESDFAGLQSEYETLERQLLFAGEYDANNAILSVNAGAGGTEAQDWTQMLVRAYLRWAQQHNFSVEVLEETLGDEAGLKGFQAIISGTNAYGHVKAEAGVHRLVRISPFNAAGKRMTSFCSVDVVPEISDDIKIDINPKDLRIDYFLSGGAGGQNVQKNETAVRITHLPSGLVAQCQNERSQGRNREVAMRVLESRLWEIEWRKQQEEIARVRGDVGKNEWGSQIRSYVFQPYQMVKDHRTGHETGNVDAVMDGDFDGFIFAYLEQTAGQAAAAAS
jgi:peptide chain release factor 2